MPSNILGMFDLWPVMNKCTVVSKRELFFAWPFGLAAWLCGLIFINRMRSNQAREQLWKASSDIKNKKIKLWIFPEGTRRNTGELHRFKKGAFHVAIDAQLPILPVVFSSYRTFLDDKNKHFNSGRIIVTTLPPIQTAGLTKEHLEELMQHTYNAMNAVFQQISKEVSDDLNMPDQYQCIPMKPPLASDLSNRNFDNSVIDMNGSHCSFDEESDHNGQQMYTTIIQKHSHRTTLPPTAN